jgi:hypothetical protein
MTASLLDTPADSGALVESSTLVPIDILDGKGSGSCLVYSGFASLLMVWSCACCIV